MVQVKRIVTEEVKGNLLDAIYKCREASIQLTAKAPIYGPEYVAADKLRSALDDMTGTLTGNRELFWAQQSSTPKNCMRSAATDKP